MAFSQRMREFLLPPAPPTITPSNPANDGLTSTPLAIPVPVAVPMQDKALVNDKSVAVAVKAISLSTLPTACTNAAPSSTAAGIFGLEASKPRGVRRGVINEQSVEPSDLTEVSHVPKTVQTRALITQALRKHYLFNSLEQSEVDEMIDVMTRVTVQAGDDIIVQGTPGNCFYVLESGASDILVENKFVGQYSSGDAFGELALLYNCPRAATIRATTGCLLWSVERMMFRKVMASTASATQRARVTFLQNVQLLQRLSNTQLQKIAAALKLQRFQDGDHIIRQGDQGHTFYLIVDGRVKCTSRTQDGLEKELMVLSRGQYFGEMALMLNEPRQANCIAMGTCDCYVMDRASFTRLLGPLRSLIDRQMRIRVLRSVPLLTSLTDDELDILAHALNVVCFEDQTTILKEGDAGNTFFMISDGKVSVRKHAMQVMQLHAGDFFGERALLSNEPRAADCVAVGRVECLTLERTAFEKLLGRLEHIMQRERQRQQMLQAAVLGPAVENEHRAAHARVGPTRTRTGDSSSTTPKIAFTDLERVRTIGTGTFGRVILVRHRPTNTAYALKCMEKTNLVETHQQQNVLYEKGILLECDHPFIITLFETYNDANQLYMLFELVPGGELWTLLYEKAFRVPKGNCGAFDLSAARFYTANVAEALRYLQHMDIAYRDLKPENLVLDAKGYLKVVDFGFAKHVPYTKHGQRQDRSFTLCGTPEYLAPELVLNKGHGKPVDHWALGCLLYELLVGRTPFQHNDQNKIFEKILQGRQHIKFPPQFDPDARDLVMKLLEPNPALRLGSLAGGMKEVVDHRFFTNATFDWRAMLDKTITAPFVPALTDAFDTNNFDAYAEDAPVRPFHGPDVFQGF